MGDQKRKTLLQKESARLQREGDVEALLRLQDLHRRRDEPFPDPLLGLLDDLLAEDTQLAVQTLRGVGVPASVQAWRFPAETDDVERPGIVVDSVDRPGAAALLVTEAAYTALLAESEVEAGLDLPPLAYGTLRDISAWDTSARPEQYAHLVEKGVHRILVRVTATEPEGEPFTDEDLLEGVQATLHEVFPKYDLLVVPTVELVGS